jgi:hypothetical protein
LVDTKVNPGFPLPEFMVNSVTADAKFFLLASIVIICPDGFNDKSVAL